MNECITIASCCEPYGLISAPFTPHFAQLTCAAWPFQLPFHGEEHWPRPDSPSCRFLCLVLCVHLILIMLSLHAKARDARRAATPVGTPSSVLIVHAVKVRPDWCERHSDLRETAFGRIQQCLTDDFCITMPARRPGGTRTSFLNHDGGREALRMLPRTAQRRLRCA